MECSPTATLASFPSEKMAVSGTGSFLVPWAVNQLTRKVVVNSVVFCLDSSVLSVYTGTFLFENIVFLLVFGF